MVYMDRKAVPVWQPLMLLVTAMANVVLRKATDNVSLYWSDEVVRKVIFFSTSLPPAHTGCAF